MKLVSGTSTAAVLVVTAAAAGFPFGMGGMGGMMGMHHHMPGEMGGMMNPIMHHHHHPGEGMMNPMMHHHHPGEGMMMGGGGFMPPMMGGPFGMYRRRLAATDEPVVARGPYYANGEIQELMQQHQKPADAGKATIRAHTLSELRDKCCGECPAGGIGCLARCSKECGNLDECTAAGKGGYAAICQRGCFKFPLLQPSDRTNWQPTTTCEEICVKVATELCHASNNCELDYGCVVDQCETAAREMCNTDRWRDYIRRNN